MCPNCRQDADLEAPVDVETETWEAILRTTDSRTPSTEPGTSQEPQVKVIDFQPLPDVLSSPTQRETRLADNLNNLSLYPLFEDTNSPENPEIGLDLTTTLSPSISNPQSPPNSTALRSPSALPTPPVLISRRIQTLSAARDGFEDLGSLSATPTIDRGPFVYGDMTVNADGTAEATTSGGDVLQLPRESMSDDVGTTSKAF